MVLWVGIDDTDSARTMCTTFVAAELLARQSSLDVIGYPRLVRLNPNVPWKTRGNGALCLRFGRGRGRPFPIGEVKGRPLRAFPQGTDAAPDPAFRKLCEDVLRRWADLEDPDSRPGLVVTRRRPNADLYWQAVREIVSLEAIAPWLARADLVVAPKGRRGLIGATASLAWRPPDRTYEVLAYRRRDRWATPRQVHEGDVQRLDRAYPSTFHNYDRETGHPVVVPRSACPVLLGIRGEDVDALPAARASVRTEPVERWLLFETNQATDDHLVPRKIRHLRPHTSAIVTGSVAAPPTTHPGGHVVFPLANGGRVDCAAYEPSKSFRRVARALRPGDRIRAYGAVRRVPRTLNLEKLEVLALGPHRVKVANPTCPGCYRSMKSVGQRAGYRCRPCGTRAAPGAAEFVVRPRSLRPGLYEPPVAARRHLHKPLRRMGAA